MACGECYGAGCKSCGSLGGFLCPEPHPKAGACRSCRGAGVAPPDPERCAGCSGTRRAPDGAIARLRIGTRTRGLTLDERKKAGTVLGAAVRFSLDSKDQYGRFTLREPRWIPTGALGPTEKATVFSNASTLWVLLSARVGLDRPGMADAWRALRSDARGLVSGEIDPREQNVQAVSLVLRALIAGGEPTDSDLVVGLVRRLASGQRPSGYWDEVIESMEPGDAFASLFAVEALWNAQRRGAKVPTEVFSKALAAGQKVATALPKAMRRDGFLTGTSVASGAALIVMAKAGTLGDRARDLEEYRSMPQVAQALAWLDRHFEIAHEPKIQSGARVRPSGPLEGGYSAWLYAVERLALLLAIDQLGGRRWYTEGCRHLIGLARSDGVFEETGLGRLNGPVRTTSMVVLFLSRATTPLTGEDPDDEESIFDR